MVIEDAQTEILVWVYTIVIIICLITFRSGRIVICIITLLILTRIMNQGLRPFRYWRKSCHLTCHCFRCKYWC
jgi:hypothetical protein